MNDCSVKHAFPREAFLFSGQSSLEVWTLHDLFEQRGWAAYDHFLSHEPELCLQRMRELVENFSTWQHRASTGRRPYDERVHLLAALVRQFFDASFRSTESFLRLLAGFFRLERAPDANTLSRVNRTRRFTIVLRRFQAWILDQLPLRRSVIAIDATGYSNKKASWSETDYGLRATQPWLKVHVAVEIPTLLYVSTVVTPGRVHDSRAFGTVLDDLHDTIRPVRTLADAAYAGDACLRAAEEIGATPLHKFRKDARYFRFPTTRLQKLVNFATHWPNRFAALIGPRSLVEAAFSSTKQRFGQQLRCRHPVARLNEILAKQVAHNARILLIRESCGLATF